MAKRRKKGYWLSLALAIILTLAAAKTLLPNPDAGKDCRLGYRAGCSFTPYSTLILVALAYGNCRLRKRFLTEIVPDEPGVSQ
ncbi:MAG: hypothetical protein GF403_00505 [Candidatus Coatesbacteria bacterium]|nr:hypothetical protein [Candidatus Coatesbacteria bacterium]